MGCEIRTSRGGEELLPGGGALGGAPGAPRGDEHKDSHQAGCGRSPCPWIRQPSNTDTSPVRRNTAEAPIGRVAGALPTRPGAATTPGGCARPVQAAQAGAAGTFADHLTPAGPGPPWTGLLFTVSWRS